MKFKLLLLSFLVMFLFIPPAYSADQNSFVPTVPVKVQKVTTDRVSFVSEFIGTAEAIQRVEVKPEISARITRVHFREGSFVNAGAVLFTLDSESYAAIRDLRKAEQAEAIADLENNRKLLSRLRAADRRSVPAADMDKAESQVKVSQAKVAEAKAQLRLAQIDVNHTRITAPISGFIGKAEHTKGSYVTTGTPLVTIVQISPIRVGFSVPDSFYVEYLKYFQSIDDLPDPTFELILADGSVYEGKGQIEFLSNEMDSNTGTVTAYLTFQNHDRIIRPRSLVRVRATSPEAERVMVPVSAVLTSDKGNYVYVIDNGTAKRRDVVVTLQKGNSFAIESGLKAGDTIVVEGLISISDGAKVNIQK